MSASSKLLYILTGLIQQIPSLLTMLGCIVASIVLWKRHPKVSMTVIVGMALLILSVVVFAVAYVVIPNMVLNSGSYMHTQTVRSVISFLNNTGLAIGLGVLLLAIFMQRNRAQ